MRTPYFIYLAISVYAENTAKMFKIPKTMKAVGVFENVPANKGNSLIDMNVDVPVCKETEVLINVKATALNPIDVKIKNRHNNVLPRILGWEGSGVIVDRGKDVHLLNVGDEIFFTGDVRKNGSNAEYVAIDETLVALKPKTFTFEQAAAMPSTGVTAYESIYDRLKLTKSDKNKILLIISSSCGVGSVASQFAKNLGLKVIGTATRNESAVFTRRNGADLVLNHGEDLEKQLRQHNIDYVDYIMINFDPFPYWNVMMKIIRPQGKICVLGDSSKPVDIKLLKDKSITLVSEMMSTRIKYNTEDKRRHTEILNEISNKCDSGELKCILTMNLSPLNEINLRMAHRLLEAKSLYGKLVISGF